MSAPEKDSLKTPAIRQLGILAGGGTLPKMLIKACEDQNIKPFIIAFEDQTDPDTPPNHPHIWTRLGAAGEIFKALKTQNIQDIVLIGKITRPSLAEIRPDIQGTKILAKIGLNTLGDDGVLKALRKALEDEGFHIHGIQKFVREILPADGALTKLSPSKAAQQDIDKAVRTLQHLSPLDIGQSLVIQEGRILGIEAAEGTDALIKRCAPLARKGAKPILVKIPKDNQDTDLDLPTIGEETLKNIIDANYAGIAFAAKATLLIEEEKLAKIADKHKVFLYGVKLTQDTKE